MASNQDMQPIHAPRLAAETANSHRVAMLVFPDAQILDIAGPLEVFARAARWLNDHLGRRIPAYSVELVASEEGPVSTSCGLSLLATRAFRNLESADTLLVTGGIGYARACEDRELLDWLAAQAGRVPRLASICTGALVLAAAGLLDGKTATTHWAYCQTLARMAPNCRVEANALFVESGSIFTSAGVTAGIDLALALVERDWGRTVAVGVAQELVLYRRRTADQAQISRYLEAERHSDRFGSLLVWILDHLGENLATERLAERVALSPRHFNRLFKSRLGMSPAQYVARLRVEEASRLMAAGQCSLKDVARRCGFGDEQGMRRAFLRQLGVLPQDVRAMP